MRRGERSVKGRAGGGSLTLIHSIDEQRMERVGRLEIGDMGINVEIPSTGDTDRIWRRGISYNAFVNFYLIRFGLENCRLAFLGFSE